MATRDDIVFDVKLENANSLKALKQLYKEQQEELQKAKKGTQEYDQALRRLGSVKDEMGDLRDTISALNPEGKVAAFSNAAGKIAGGFQAAAGAAALFGVQNEELEKTLLRVQAATAFAQGITSIAGLSDAFAVLGTVIKTQVVTAFSTLTGAIAATGIGALIVAIGVLIYKTKEYNEAIEDEYGKQKKLNEELKKTTDEYLKQAAASEDLRNRRKGGLNELERELKLLEASGASAEKVFQKKKEVIDAEIYNLKVRRATVEGDAEAQAKITDEIIKKETEKLVIQAQFEKMLQDESKKSVEEQKRASEARIKNMQEYLTNRSALEEEFAINSAIADQKLREQETAEAIEQIKQRAEAEAYYKSITDQIDEESRQMRRNKAKSDNAEFIALEKQKADAKQQIETQSFAAAKGLSDAFFAIQLNNAKGNAEQELKIRKKQFEVDKAFSIARAVIDGVRAVQAALTIPPPFGPILAGVNGLLAAANVAKIASTKFDGGSSSSFSAPSSSSVNVAAPNISAPVQPSTRLNENGTPIQNQPIKVTVDARIVESQMTERQRESERFQNQTRF